VNKDRGQMVLVSNVGSIWALISLRSSVSRRWG